MIKLLIITLLIVAPRIAQAGFLDTLECVSTDNTTDASKVLAGGCTLTDISIGLVQLIQLMLGAIGALALFYMAWGAFYWVTSMGFPTKVKKGQDIMLNTIFALLLTFTSYIILDFFVNKLLVVKDEYQIKSQCTGLPEGSICNLNVGSNYVCDESSNCITKCDLRAKETGQKWECIYLENPEGADTTYPQFFVRNLCPNDEHYVCTRIDHPDYENYVDLWEQIMSGDIDLSY